MNRSIAATTGGAAIGLLVDRLVGEPPNSVHPVARFGQDYADTLAEWQERFQTAAEYRREQTRRRTSRASSISMSMPS